VIVSLAPHEALEAAIEGVKRRGRGAFNGLGQPHGKPAGEPWQRDIEGASAEVAFAKAMNLYWAPSQGGQGNSPAGDVAGWEVRWTARAGGRLLVHRSDRDDAPYVLVTGTWPKYRIRGYMLGRDAKAKRYWTTTGTFASRPCFAVPAADLTRLTGREGGWEPA
jgi:hypothetical protein